MNNNCGCNNTKDNDYKRPDWDNYFINIMHEVAKRATCNRGRCGCVIAKDNHILATGYVGSPPGLEHCDEVGHLFRHVKYEDGTEKQHCVRTIHAEQNAICAAAKFGIALNGATLYTGMEPCETCARLIIAAGIKRVVSEFKYPGATSNTKKMFDKVGIKQEFIQDKEMQYEKK